MKHLLLFLFLVASVPAFSQAKPAPCNLPEHSQFDFWLGKWSVTTANGKPAGVNSIAKIEGGCAISENWVSATPGYTGTSYNFYNQQDKQWEQLWLDNQGGVLKLAGNRSDNQMVLRSAPAVNGDGDEVIQQITWTLNDDRSVRQLWEVLTSGKDTTVAFDGLYKKSE